MQTIYIKSKNSTICDIEKILLDTDRTDKDSKLVFSSGVFNLRKSAMHDASRLQMLMTLARQNIKNKKFILNPSSNNEKVLRDIGDYSPGIAFARLTIGATLGEEELSRKDLLTPARQKILDTNIGRYNSIIKGRTLDFIFVSGSRTRFLKPLFTHNHKVKKPSLMFSTVSNLVEEVNKSSSDKISSNLVESLSVLTSELLKNTQEHATSDREGVEYSSHVEGMIMSWKRLARDDFEQDFSGNEFLKKYWQNSLEITGNCKESFRVFEVSYFDTGPGFVSRYTGLDVDEMSLDEEFNFLKKAFLHKSSSKNQNAAGEGLPTVLEELKKIGGLIRVRSGRLSVFNAFMLDGNDRDIYEFKNWTDKKLRKVEGAVVSILIPLRQSI